MNNMFGSPDNDKTEVTFEEFIVAIRRQIDETYEYKQWCDLEVMEKLGQIRN